MTSRSRLLIAGHDLKFVEPLFPYLQKFYEVRVDRWDGPETHDSAYSKELVEWADIIYCEWMLGNAVWYSWNKKPQQRLVVRLHLFELKREYGHLLKQSAVDQVIVVSRPLLERTVSTFAFPRSKVRVVPNACRQPPLVSANGVGEEQLSQDKWLRSRRFCLALVGAVPSRKGVDRVLDVLEELWTSDNRYRLSIYGATPESVDWVWRDSAEREYFLRCQQRIEQAPWGGAVTWHGWSTMSEHYPEIGFVTSVSDEESFHVAPVEAAFAGAIPLVLPWPGAHWVHPPSVLVSNLSAMVNRVRELQDFEAAYARWCSLRDFYARYQPDQVAEQYFLTLGDSHA